MRIMFSVEKVNGVWGVREFMEHTPPDGVTDDKSLNSMTLLNVPEISVKVENYKTLLKSRYYTMLQGDEHNFGVGHIESDDPDIRYKLHDYLRVLNDAQVGKLMRRVQVKFSEE